MARLWRVMAACYGSRWEVNYGDAIAMSGQLTTTAKEWCDVFRNEGITPDDIARGIEACHQRAKQLEKAGKTSEAGWPPNRAQFVAMCQQRPAAPYHKPFPSTTEALPLPPSHSAALASAQAKLEALADDYQPPETLPPGVSAVAHRQLHIMRRLAAMRKSHGPGSKPVGYLTRDETLALYQHLRTR